MEGSGFHQPPHLPAHRSTILQKWQGGAVPRRTWPDPSWTVRAPVSLLRPRIRRPVARQPGGVAVARVMTPPASGLELPAGPYDTGENCATNDDDVMRIWPGAACRENEN